MPWGKSLVEIARVPSKDDIHKTRRRVGEAPKKRAESAQAQSMKNTFTMEPSLLGLSTQSEPLEVVD